MNSAIHPDRRAYIRAARRQRRHQRGAALIVALVLLIVVAFVGFAGISLSILQNKATSNQYGRQVAFQNAEAAMRSAAALIPSNPAIVARDCQLVGIVCGTNPFTDSTLPAGSVHGVQATNPVAGAGFTVSTLAPMQPQFVVESLGNWANSQGSANFTNTANARNYGVQGSTTTAAYYRITARSCDPTNSLCAGAALVVLQAVIKRG
jgi:type IV pilus assembly protein PilX